VRFEKWQALGNDYVIVERDELPFELTAARIRRLCEGHLGISADGVLMLSAPADPADVADLRIFNPDGSEAELSGNGARQAILYLRRRGWTERDTFTLHTAAGRIRPHITGPSTCTVEMGSATLRSRDFPDGPEDGAGTIEAGGREWRFRHISIGNPQCAIEVASAEELGALEPAELGPQIESDARFPNRTNVSWYAAISSAPAGPHVIRARIFERGAGETLSSGTGASGAAVAYTLEHALRGSGGRVAVTVALDGGELEVEVGDDLHVNLTGWAKPVFEGRLSDEFTKELHETE
jgi:diaminopimelate epimerase